MPDVWDVADAAPASPRGTREGGGRAARPREAVAVTPRIRQKVASVRAGRPDAPCQVCEIGGQWWDCSTARSRSSPAQGAASAAAEALLLAAEGAKVVVNDLGGEWDGAGQPTTARRSRWSTRSRPRVARPPPTTTTSPTGTGGQALVQQAVDDVRRARHAREQRRHPPGQDELQHGRGRLGRGHPRPPQGPLRAEPASRPTYWRSKSKETGAAGQRARSSTPSSESGLYGNAGQLNYAAAKAGIASMTIVLARELERIGVARQRHRPGRAHAPHREPHGRGTRRHEGSSSRPTTSPPSSAGWRPTSPRRCPARW